MLWVWSCRGCTLWVWSSSVLSSSWTWFWVFWAGEQLLFSLHRRRWSLFSPSRLSPRSKLRSSITGVSHGFVLVSPSGLTVLFGPLYRWMTPSDGRPRGSTLLVWSFWARFLCWTLCWVCSAGKTSTTICAVVWWSALLLTSVLRTVFSVDLHGVWWRDYGSVSIYIQS